MYKAWLFLAAMPQPAWQLGGKAVSTLGKLQCNWNSSPIRVVEYLSDSGHVMRQDDGGWAEQRPGTLPCHSRHWCGLPFYSPEQSERSSGYPTLDGRHTGMVQVKGEELRVKRESRNMAARGAIPVRGKDMRTWEYAWHHLPAEDSKWVQPVPRTSSP